MPAAISIRDDYTAIELRKLAGHAKDANLVRELLNQVTPVGWGRGSTSLHGSELK